MLRNYLLLAWKVLLRRKFFTFISLVGISLTLATLLVVAAFVDHFTYPPKPYSKQSRMLFVKTMMAEGKDNTTIDAPHYGFHDKYVRSLPNIEKFTIQGVATFITYPKGKKAILNARTVDGAFWEIYDFNFLEGSAFSEDDNKQERLVAVVNEQTRQRFFGNEPALGKPILLGDKTYRIVGVVPNVGESMDASADVWIPVSIGLTAEARAALIGGLSGNYNSTILLKSEQDAQFVRDAFQAMLLRVQFPTSEYTTIYGVAGTQLEHIAQQFFGFESNRAAYTSNKARQFIALLLAIGLVFMLLPAINLINVNVSRIIERASEIGVRKAFGATGRSLVGQFIVENLVLTIIGGAIGLVLAEVVLMWVTNMGFIAHAVLHVNLRVAAYGLGFSAFFGLLSGVLPAWKMSRLPIVASLKGGINA
jgi:putative ABC transport system permease protein